MITEPKIQLEIVAYLFTLALVFILLGKYGRQAKERILMKLYEIFIQKNLMNL